MTDFDVIIIGAGVVGSSIARELSRYDVKAAVIEKASDVCEGTSKANSGIVHAGFDAKSGTRKAYFNVLGSKMMEKLSEELDFEYKKNGSMVLCFNEDDIDKLYELKSRGEQNGVDGLRVLSHEEVMVKEPNLSEEVYAALYAPTGAIVCPFGLTLAMAENAFVNGVEFKLGEEVLNIVKSGREFKVTTSEGEYNTKVVVNAAGVYADKFHNMVCEDKFTITARKGEYCLYDKKVGDTVHSTIFQLPTALGKGVLVTPTVHGNMLIGPTATDTSDKEEVCTSSEGLAVVAAKGAVSLKNVPSKSVITSFAGLRAHSDRGDFIIGESSTEGFIDAAGIESPGLSAAPAIGEYVAGLCGKILNLSFKENFISRRKGVPSMATASLAAKEKLIKENPMFANVICRCELVTEGEIVDAINRPLGATTLDGVKRRTRAGMGRCQAGFCTPKTVEILSRELKVKKTDITKHGKGSELIYNHKGREDQKA